MSTHTVLILEEDADTRTDLIERLREQGFVTLTCSAADDVAGIVRDQAADIALVAARAGGRDGYRIARDLRYQTGAGVIVLGHSTDEVDVALALEMGADDYVVKPVRPRELGARIRTVLRRTVVTPADAGGARPLPDHFLRRLGDLEICGVIRQVSVGGREVGLTAMEFDVLMVLAANPNAVLSRARIMAAVHGRDWSVNDRAVDGIVSRLRRKLFGAEEGTRRIRTVHGRGYMLLETG